MHKQYTWNFLLENRRYILVYCGYGVKYYISINQSIPFFTHMGVVTTTSKGLQSLSMLGTNGH